MALPPEYVALLRVGINSSPEWMEAWSRVNDYLDALGAPAGTDREEVLLPSFGQAIARKRDEPFVPALQLAFEETQKVLDHLLGHLIPSELPFVDRFVEERVRLYLGGTKGESVILRTRADLAPELIEALRLTHLQSSPLIQSANITPKPLVFSAFGRRLVAWASQLSFLGSRRAVAWTLGAILIAVLAYLSL
jgi:hypothetical protein